MRARLFPVLAAAFLLAWPAQAGPALYFSFGSAGCYQQAPVVCQPVIVCSPVQYWGYGPYWGTRSLIISEAPVIITPAAPSIGPAGKIRVAYPLQRNKQGVSFYWRN